MAALYGEEQPPSYSEAVGDNYDTILPGAGTAAIHTGTTQMYNARQISIGIIQQMVVPEDIQHTTNSNVVRPERRESTADNRTMGTQNASNSFSGFIDILYKHKKLPWGFGKNMTYKVVLLVYYFLNLFYTIIGIAIQQEHFTYHLVYMFVSLAGFLFELVVILFDVRRYLIESRDVTDHATQSGPNQVIHTDQPTEAWRPNEQIQDYHNKAKSVFVDYILLSLGEFLIYPILVCALYGFINEKGWKFNNGISGFNFLYLLYSLIMDAIYMKFYLVFLVMKIVNVSYAEYDELLRPTVVEWKRCFTPVYLTILYAMMTALIHWFMIGIIGVRIYVDNFTLDRDDTNSSVPNTGDYRVASFTGYMIGCGIYLPIASWIGYIIMNKSWFYEVFSAINQLNHGADIMPTLEPWNKKLFMFITDPLAYIAASILMVPFIVYTVGIFLPDYNSSDFATASGAKNAAEGLGVCFIIIFLFSNYQAVIDFTITLVVAITLIVGGLPILCGVACYKCVNG